MRVPRLPNASFAPVWSGCQCVLKSAASGAPADCSSTSCASAAEVSAGPLSTSTAPLAVRSSSMLARSARIWISPSRSLVVRSGAGRCAAARRNGPSTAEEADSPAAPSARRRKSRRFRGRGCIRRRSVGRAAGLVQAVGQGVGAALLRVGHRKLVPGVRVAVGVLSNRAGPGLNAERMFPSLCGTPHKRREQTSASLFPMDRKIERERRQLRMELAQACTNYERAVAAVRTNRTTAAALAQDEARDKLNTLNRRMSDLDYQLEALPIG